MSESIRYDDVAALGGLCVTHEGARGTLVLAHGAGHDHHALVALARAITALDVVLLDLPGRGLSRGAPCESVAEAAARVLRFADGAGLRAPVLVGGHSLGGAVAIEAALTRPVPGLVLISTGARLRVRPSILDDARAVAEGRATRTRGVGYGPSVDPEVREALERAFDRVPPSTTLADWTMANAFDRLGDAAHVASPTLVVHGDDDPFTPWKYAEHLARAIAGATLVRVAGGSHMAIVERTAEIARAIDAFAP